MKLSHEVPYLKDLSKDRQVALLVRLKGEVENMRELEEYEGKYPLYSTGITYWWYSHRLNIFMAMKSKAAPKPLLEESDWLLVGTAKDGEVLC